MTTKEKLASGMSKEELINAYISKVESAEKELLQEKVSEETKVEDIQNLYAALKTYLCKYTEISPEGFPSLEEFQDILDEVNENIRTLMVVMKSFF